MQMLFEFLNVHNIRAHGQSYILYCKITIAIRLNKFGK